MHDILIRYQEVTRKLIKYDKSVIVFSSKVSEEPKNNIKKCIPIKCVTNLGNYLGLPTHLGKSKRSDLDYILERIRANLHGWKEKNLSYVAKSIIIKVIT